MEPKHAGLPSFGLLFQEMILNGGDLKKVLEEKLEDKTVRIAFQRFIAEHPDLVSQSPLLHHAFDHSSQSLAMTSLKIKEIGQDQFRLNPNIQQLEDAIFEQGGIQLPGELNHSQFKHLQSLNEAGLINDNCLISLLSTQDSEGNFLLFYPWEFEDALPWLQTLADTKPDLLVKILSIPNIGGSTLLANNDRAVRPLLQKLADTQPKLLYDLLSIQDVTGNTTLHYLLRLPDPLPWLHTLVNKTPDLVLKLMSITNNDLRNILQENRNMKAGLAFIKDVAKYHLTFASELFYISMLSDKAKDAFHAEALKLMRSIPEGTPIPPKLAAVILSQREKYPNSESERMRLKPALDQFLRSAARDVAAVYASSAITLGLFNERDKIFPYLQTITAKKHQPGISKSK